MIGYDQTLLRIVDEMLTRRLSAYQAPVMGTIVDPNTQLYIWDTSVVIEPSGVVVSARKFTNEKLQNGDRVGLIKFGSLWVIVGGYTFYQNFWTTYDPLWEAGGGNPAINNGSIFARWRKMDRMCIVEFKILMGSSTTYGSGQWTLTLPFTAHPDAVTTGSVGAISILDSGTTTRSGTVVLDTTTKMTFETTGGVTSTGPQTWAVNDYLKGQIEYEYVFP